jgi:signal transduction histidine kinase
LLSVRLDRNGALTDRDRRTLQIMRRQGEQLNRLIGGLLDFSRIQSGRLDLECAPLDLCDLVRRIVDEEALDDRDHPVECWTPDEPLMVNGDAVRLEQVVQNLLQNAIKYSPKGSPIRVRVEHQTDEATIAVSDQGIGIPADALPHIFERFYRADNVDARHVSGLGVGLFVVREIAGLHGGSVDVASEQGHGSTFTVRLPLLEG